MGQALQDKQHTPPLPLMAALRGANGLLPLWANEEGCDFVRGTRVTNRALTSETMALEQHEFFCSLCGGSPSHTLSRQALWDHGAYQVTLADCPEHIVALDTRADSLLTQVANTTVAASLLKDGVAECWTSWSESVFFSCVCLLASMARSVNCLGRKKAVQVHLIGAKPIVQVKR